MKETRRYRDRIQQAEVIEYEAIKLAELGKCGEANRIKSIADKLRRQAHAMTIGEATDGR
jgi:hypothetical protein